MAESKNRPRVLFVDDEPSIRLTLPPVLQESGFEVHVSESVSDALFEINTNPYDVLISDLNIGEEGDGFLVVSAMRHIQPKCTNFILTGYPAFETALQAIQNQVDDYLVKPVEIESLVKSVRDKVDSRKSGPMAGWRLPSLMKENFASFADGAPEAEAGETTPAAGPLSMICAGAAAANVADASPPFDCINCNGASIPSARNLASNAVIYARTTGCT